MADVKLSICSGTTVGVVASGVIVTSSWQQLFPTSAAIKELAGVDSTLADYLAGANTEDVINLPGAARSAQFLSLPPRVLKPNAVYIFQVLLDVRVVISQQTSAVMFLVAKNAY